MADEPKTDGTTSVSGSPTQGEKQATGTGNDKPAVVPMDRFEGVVAERNREKERVNALQKQLQDLTDQHKTDDEKRLDQLVTERYGPRLKRLDSLEQRLTTERDELVTKIPQEHRGMLVLNESVPIEDQIQQARSVISFLGQSKPGSFAGGGSPGNGGARTYTKEQFQMWQNLPTLGKLKEYDEQKAEMTAAYREKRIIGIT